MIALLSRLPAPVLTVLGVALVGLFVAALVDGISARRAGFLGLACLAIVVLGLVRSRRPRRPHGR